MKILKRPSLLVSVVKSTTNFELKDDGNTSVKLTWNISCPLNYMSPVPVSFTNNR